MNSYKTKTFIGTFLFCGVFLGLCFAFINYLPENKIEKPIVKTESTFSSISLVQNALSDVEITENIDVNNFGVLTSAGFDAAFDESFRELDEFKKLSDELKSEIKINPENASEIDKELQLYRETLSRPMVEWFYTRLTSNRDVALAILENADKHDIAPSLAFALAYVESNFKPNAVNNNTNKTIDRGLFQLNNATFPKLTEKEFFDPNVSAKYGIAHLKFCLDVAGNDITALAMYNAGTTRVRSNKTPQHTLNYVAKISTYRKNIENQFSSEILALYDSDKMIALY